MTDKEKEIESLKQEIVGLKIRIHRMEDMLRSFPSSEEYLEPTSAGDDPIFDEVANAIQSLDTASASYIQRKFEVGYSRAARIMDGLEKKGIIAPGSGSVPRKVLKKV